MKRKKDRPLKSSLANKIDSLFGSSTPSQKTPALLLELIVFPAYQPRQYFESAQLEKLALSISQYGILEPLIVRKLEENQYELVAGGRRYRAAQLAKLTKVPVVILNLTDTEALEIAILENLQREDLNPVEETEGILRLLSSRLNLEESEVISLLYRMRNEVKGATSRNVSASPAAKVVEEIFSPLGITWKSFTETRLPLLKLPKEILEVLRKGKLAYTKAQVIAKVKDEQERNKLLAEAIAGNLSLSQIKEKIKQIQPGASFAFSHLQLTYKRLKKAKLWETNPQKWKQVTELLNQINSLIKDN